MKRVQFVGLDVHADTIAVAVAEPGGTVRSVGVIPNRPESIRKLVKQLGSPERVPVARIVPLRTSGPLPQLATMQGRSP